MLVPLRQKYTYSLFSQKLPWWTLIIFQVGMAVLAGFAGSSFVGMLFLAVSSFLLSLQFCGDSSQEKKMIFYWLPMVHILLLVSGISTLHEQLFGWMPASDHSDRTNRGVVPKSREYLSFLSVFLTPPYKSELSILRTGKNYLSFSPADQRESRANREGGACRRFRQWNDSVSSSFRSSF